MEALLQKAVSLFRFIQEKDIFERHYKNLLAKRLLLGKSLFDDLERFALGKIKTECGFQFTSKMEGMFKDMSLSADTQTAFKDYISNTDVSNCQRTISLTRLGTDKTPIGAYGQCTHIHLLAHHHQCLFAEHA